MSITILEFDDSVCRLIKVENCVVEALYAKALKCPIVPHEGIEVRLTIELYVSLITFVYSLASILMLVLGSSVPISVRYI